MQNITRTRRDAVVIVTEKNDNKKNTNNNNNSHRTKQKKKMRAKWAIAATVRVYTVWSLDELTTIYIVRASFRDSVYIRMLVVKGQHTFYATIINVTCVLVLRWHWHSHIHGQTEQYTYFVRYTWIWIHFLMKFNSNVLFFSFYFVWFVLILPQHSARRHRMTMLKRLWCECHTSGVYVFVHAAI